MRLVEHVSWKLLAAAAFAVYLAEASAAGPPLYLYNSDGGEEWKYCFDQPLTAPEYQCPTSTATATPASTTFSTTSISECTIYDDCFATCDEMAAMDGNPCATVFCPTCEQAHKCDTACAICSRDTTTSATSSATSLTSTMTSTSTSHTTAYLSAVSTVTQTGSFTTLDCYKVNLLGDSQCAQLCSAGDCHVSLCQVLFCPSCPSELAGMCDETCAFCTASTSSATSTASISSTSRTTDTVTTLSQTTGTVTTSTRTTITVTTTMNTPTLTATGTVCYTYDDCMDSCPYFAGAGMCITDFCPTCSSSHICDESCFQATRDPSFCASNDPNFTGVPTTGVLTVTMTTTSVTTTTGSTASTVSTFTCDGSNNSWGDDLCQRTIADQGCCEPCETLFCPTCSFGAGMCDLACGLCNTHTATTRTTTTLTSGTGTTTTTCFKYLDCLPNYVCQNTSSNCEAVYCPTCNGQHLCDETCGFCAENTTTTETTTGTGTTVTQTSTTETECIQTDKVPVDAGLVPPYANASDWCRAQCTINPSWGDDGNPSVCTPCTTLFCPTCSLAGWCDLTCNICDRATSTITGSTATASTTYTCPPCKVSADIPLVGCDEPLGCGESRRCAAYNASSCMGSFEFEYTCRSDGDDGSVDVPSVMSWPLGPEWANSSVFLYNYSSHTQDSGQDGMRLAELSNVSGSFGINCQVCGLGAATGDADTGCSKFEVGVSFGPNILGSGSVDESMLSGYQVSLVRACEGLDRPHSSAVPLAFVNKSTPTAITAEECICSGVHAYNVTVNGELPDITNDYRLMVSPVMADGTVVPVGMTTDVIVDNCTGAVLSGQISIQGDSSDDASQLYQDIVEALAEAYGVAPSQIVISSLTFTPSGGRRLAPGTWLVDYEVRVADNAAEALVQEAEVSTSTFEERLVSAFSARSLIVTMVGGVVETQELRPTAAPTTEPSPSPTEAPTTAPTTSPTQAPTAPPPSPTEAPTASPTFSPTEVPTAGPTASPTDSPASPTEVPTASPTPLAVEDQAAPTSMPTAIPTGVPTAAPSAVPTPLPTDAPTSAPTVGPSATPATEPAVSPEPSREESLGASPAPTAAPASPPSLAPTSQPTAAPTSEPTAAPLGEPPPGESIGARAEAEAAAEAEANSGTAVPVAVTLTAIGVLSAMGLAAALRKRRRAPKGHQAEPYDARKDGDSELGSDRQEPAARVEDATQLLEQLPAVNPLLQVRHLPAVVAGNQDVLEQSRALPVRQLVPNLMGSNVVWDDDVELPLASGRGLSSEGHGGRAVAEANENPPADGADRDREHARVDEHQRPAMGKPVERGDPPRVITSL